MMQPSRLDVFLVTRGYVSGREKAKELITAGAVTVNGKPAKKAAQTVFDTDCILCDTSSLRYVGRGGLKMEKALQMLHTAVTQWVAMDVGASTGGFTDCLLQNGVRQVYAIDVGTDQLAPSLRHDPRVIVLEETDIRDAKLHVIIPPHSVDLCVIDVSFISLKQVLPAVLPYLRDGAHLAALIKPQFEAGKAAVGKRGVVKDAGVHRQVLENLCQFFMQQHLQIQDLSYSPIAGGEGNIEFLVTLVYNCKNTLAPLPVSIAETVETAHKILQKSR